MKFLLSEIAKGIWMIDPVYAQGFFPVLHALSVGKYDEVKSFFDNNEEEEKNPYASYVITSDFKKIVAVKRDGQYASPFDLAPKGSVAVTPFTGPIMKNDFCGDFGTATRSRQMKEADAHPNIAAHVIFIDSGGGSTDGTQVASEAVSGLSKPVVAFVDGMVASAAYWIGSGAQEIILSSGTDIVGSIGTMVSFTDYQEYLKQKGIKEVDIYASESIDKNRPWIDALAGKYKTMQKEILDPLNNQFVAAIKKNRQGKYDSKNADIFTGKTFIGQDAINEGLADSIGSFDQAVQRALDLSNSQSNSNPNNLQMKVQFLAAFAALSSFFGFKAVAGADTVEGEVTAEQFKELNAKLETVAVLQTDKDKLTADLKTAQDALAASANANATLKAANDSLQLVIEGKTSNPTTEKTDEINSKQDDAQALIDSLPHNQEVDANPMFKKAAASK